MAGHAEKIERRRGSRWSLLVWGGAGLLLLAPLVAMQFTDQVAWDRSDFVFMGALLFGACGAVELAVRLTGDGAYRAGVGLAVLASLLLIWINLAVGIIGNENNPANQMFAGVLLVGLVGALLGRFRPTGMARAMIAAAVAQALIGIIALVAGLGMILGLTAVFMALWLASAALFARSARGRG